MRQTIPLWFFWGGLLGSPFVGLAFVSPSWNPSGLSPLVWFVVDTQEAGES